MNSISLRHFERFYSHLLNGCGYYLLDGEMHITRNGDTIATFGTLKGIVNFLERNDKQ